MEVDLLGLLEGDVGARDTGIDGARQRVPGFVLGVVTKVSDRQNLGRVKVRFPFSGRVESAWARVAVPWAGQNRGAYFVPEVDDEVLVAFRDGDLKHPYVVGYLWSDPKARPPEAGPDARRSTLRSRSGHRITFDEGKGHESLSIVSAKGHCVVLGDSDSAADVELRIAGGKVVVTLDGATGAVSIRADKTDGVISLEAANIRLEATNGLSLHGQSVDIKGPQCVAINS
jgi:uncharacterized protein involved in type VI secretion and phage assembly